MKFLVLTLMSASLVFGSANAATDYSRYTNNGSNPVTVVSENATESLNETSITLGTNSTNTTPLLSPESSWNMDWLFSTQGLLLSALGVSIVVLVLGYHYGSITHDMVRIATSKDGTSIPPTIRAAILKVVENGIPNVCTSPKGAAQIVNPVKLQKICDKAAAEFMSRMTIAWYNVWNR